MLEGELYAEKNAIALSHLLTLIRLFLTYDELKK